MALLLRGLATACALFGLGLVAYDILTSLGYWR